MWGHGVSEALHRRDPDENGVKLSWDRPKESWPPGLNGEQTMSRLRSTATICCAPGYVFTIGGTISSVRPSSTPWRNRLCRTLYKK